MRDTDFKTTSQISIYSIRFIRIMCQKVQLHCIAFLLALSLTSVGFAQKIDTDFSSNPLLEGWSTVAGHQFQEKNTWTPPGDGSTGYITVNEGRWHSPSFSVKPFHYYRMTIETRLNVEATEEKEKKSDLKGGYWAFFCYDRQINQHPANLYSLIYPSTDWQKQQFVFMAEKATTAGHLLFRQKTDVPLSIRNVKVEPVSEKEALAWSDSVYDNLPGLQYQPPENRHGQLGNTIRKLKNGEEVTVVTLGNSVANDLANGSPALLLERAYPGSDVRWITSVGSGKGAWYFRRKNRVEEYVLRHNPDLLIMGGVSHRGQAKPFGDVIEQVRNEMDVDVLLLNGIINPPARIVGQISKIPYLNKNEARSVYNSFPERLQELADRKKVEFMNIRQAWEQYIDRVDRPRDWFMRDVVHGNTRGKQIAGRILIRYLSPKK